MQRRRLVNLIGIQALLHSHTRYPTRIFVCLSRWQTVTRTCFFATIFAHVADCLPAYVEYRYAAAAYRYAYCCTHRIVQGGMQHTPLACVLPRALSCVIVYWHIFRLVLPLAHTAHSKKLRAHPCYHGRLLPTLRTRWTPHTLFISPQRVLSCRRTVVTTRSSY
jgi:hypothetical protein